MSEETTADTDGGGCARGSLVGRERELGQLGAALEQAIAGRGSVVLLAGEPGIGKTTVARVLSARAESRGAAVLWGIGWLGEAAPAYWPWIQVVRALARRPGGAEALAAIGPGAEWLGLIAPELRSELDLPEPPPGGGAAEGRFRVYDALAELLRRASREHPLLVVLDDLQWADEASLLALSFVARALADEPVLLLGTYREAELPHDELGASALAELVGWSRRIELRGLDADAVRRLIEERGSADPHGEAVERILSVTVGNPLFVSELLNLLEAEGRLDSISSAELLPLPKGVREAIARRVAPLSQRARDALLAASVIGSQFRTATLATALAMPREALVEALGSAVDLGVVSPLPGGAERYAFSHGLIAATLYEGLPEARRVALHRAVGEALERRYGDNVDARATELAHHFLEAGDTERGVRYARRAGGQAMRQYAYDRAVGLFERALAATEPADSSLRIDLLQELGEAQTRAGDTEAARRTLVEAAESARRHDDPRALGRAALGCGIWGLSFGVDEELVALAEEAIERVRERGNADDLLARLQGLLASALYWSNEDERRLRLCDEALRRARNAYAQTGDRAGAHTLAYVLGRVMLARWGPDSATEHMSLVEELIELARRLHDLELELLARNWRISVLLELGDVAAVDQEIARVEHMAGQLHQPRAMAFLPLHRGMRAVMAGHFDEAERLMAESAGIARRVRGSVSELAATAQLLVIRNLQGRLNEVEGPLRALSDLHPGMVSLRCALAALLVQDGRREEARGELERLAGGRLPADSTYLVMLALLADVAADLDDAERARGIYERLAPYAGRWVVSPGAAPLWPVDRSLGRAAGATGDLDRALAHLADARRQGERLGARPTVALTALDMAALLAPGDPVRAAELAGEANALGRELGMEGVVREARRLVPHGAPGEPRAAGESALAGRLAAGGPVTGSMRREGDVWTLALEGHLVRIKDAKGLRHLALLLSRPGVEFHAVDLVAAGEGRPTPAGAALTGELPVRAAGEGDAGELLDTGAKAAYRHRLEDLRADIAEAEDFNDPERAARARAEYEFIARELASAVGLGGRDRKASSNAERARVNVTRAIRTALRRISEHDPRLGRLLDRTVRTGTFCAYEPDPDRPVRWTIAA